MDGCECQDISGFNDALNAAGNADIVIFIGGISVEQEGEGHDRPFIELPGNQSSLYQMIYNQLPRDDDGNVTFLCLLSSSSSPPPSSSLP